MSDGLSVSTADLAAAGSRVGASSDPTALATSTISGVQSAVSTTTVGTGIAPTAASFCASLAARCEALSALTGAQGEAIARTAQYYTAVDQSAANGFQQVYLPSPAI